MTTLSGMIGKRPTPEAKNRHEGHGKVAGPVDGGVVFFKEFSGDWAKPAPSRRLQNGWNFWYRGHSEVEHIQVSLLRFCNSGIQEYDDAVSAGVGNLTPDQARLAAQRG